MRTATISAALAAVALTLLAGCSGGSSTATGGATASSGQSAATTAGPANGAPNVDHPLDSTRWQNNPCTVLTPGQLQRLNIVKPGANGGDYGPGCTWNDNSQPLSVTYGFEFLAADHNGISDVYAAKKNFTVFRPTHIQGYPALVTYNSIMQRIHSCMISVGVTNTVVYEGDVVGMRQGDPCAATQKLVDAAMTTIKSGS